MQDFEKLGVFYLGREYDLSARGVKEDLLLYDAKDLTTHAVCVGMTGSGKTGLCLALLEEAAIDGVPAIAIDPKGDLGNLLLAFPELRGSDFRPWIDEAEAARQKVSPDEFAEQTATRWREGLKEWGQDGDRIRRCKDSVDMAIYTPGSSAGVPITVLRSFAAPPPEVVGDADSLRERVSAATSGLLALVGVDADPIRSREHILISQIVDNAWRQGQSLDLMGLVRLIQSPPISRVGSLDIESFFPAKDRADLAMRLNNLLASPGFAGWMEGEPLDIGRLLHTAEGKPRLSILSIAHLSDSERMFFVTILLNEILSWVRTQGGTSSLRAILYMDEVFGYFPPTANPPSKTPMLTLLKQARAYGLGIVLATQNPVDLDYKGLSNAGTWILGRLQTERDKARVLEGLEGASTAAGASFNRAKMEATLAALGNRVFLLNSVHQDEPVVFNSRWCLSYLRGPLSRQQIQRLMADRKAQATAAPQGAAPTTAAPASTAPNARPAGASGGDRPLLPPDVSEVFIAEGSSGSAGDYQPALYATARVHYVDAKAGVDCWSTIGVLADLEENVPENPWEHAEAQPAANLKTSDKPQSGRNFASLPAAAARPKSYSAWSKALAGHLYRNQPLNLWQATTLKEISRPEETEAQFKIRIAQRARELRDEALERLRNKYAAKLAASDNQIQRAMERIAREKSEFNAQATQTAVSLGSTILRAIFGRKITSSTNVTGAASAARSASRAARQHEDIDMAKKNLETQQVKRADLDSQIEEEKAAIATDFSDPKIETYSITPRKSDIQIEKIALAWR